MTESTRTKLLALWEKRPETKPELLEWHHAPDEVWGPIPMWIIDGSGPHADSTAEALAVAKLVEVLAHKPDTTLGITDEGDGYEVYRASDKREHDIKTRTGKTLLDALIAAAEAP
jgi:hypothetical protein